MKKYLSLLVSFLMVLTCYVTCVANEITENDIETKTYGSIKVEEYKDEANRIIRRYKNEGGLIKSDGDINFDSIKSLLFSFGLDEKNVSKLRRDDLLAIAKGKEIIAVTSYIKTDKDGNVTYVTEAEAMNAALIAKEQQNTLIHNIESGLQNREGYYDELQDSYMQVVYTITNYGGGEYLHSIDARWLIMPYYRSMDSLGACATETALIDNTQYGYYYYDAYIYSGLTGSNSVVFNYINNNYGNPINGNWYGSAGYFDLPDDIYETGYTAIYDDFRAHFQFRGSVVNPTLQTVYNAVGSYTHTRISVSFSPSITITFPGTLSASAGINVFWADPEIRGIPITVHYYP